MATKELCVPCAAALGEGYEVVKIPTRERKLTCEGCGRRRYGYEYKISAKKGARKNAK